MLLLENMPFLSLPKVVDAKAMRRLMTLSVDGTLLHVLHVLHVLLVPMVECCPVQGFLCILILLCLVVCACVCACVGA